MKKILAYDSSNLTSTVYGIEANNILRF